MPQIIMSNVTAIAHRKLRKLALRVVDELRLAAEKAVAHHEDPQKYPLPQDPNSAEQIFLHRFRELRPEIRQTAAAKTMSFVKASQAVRRKHYGNLANVDLKSPIAIESQVAALPFPEKFKLSVTDLKGLSLHGDILPASDMLPIVGTSRIRNTLSVLPGSISKLECRIHRVYCADETGVPWQGGELGKDEIYVGGTTIGPSGDTSPVKEFKVRDFNDGDIMQYYPLPRLFATFNLLDSAQWPKSYFVIFVLTEKDQGGLAGFLNGLADKARDQVKAKLIEIGTVEGGVVGAAIGVALGIVVDKIFSWLKRTWEDDIFQPINASVELPSLDSRFAGNTDSPEEIVRFQGHNATYYLTYDWQLSSDTNTAMIASYHSGKVLDVAGWSLENGTQIIQYDRHGGDNQLFRIEPIDAGWVRIVAKHSEKVLDLYNWSFDNGAPIVQWDWHGGENQRWFLEPLDDGYVLIRSFHSGKVLDLYNWSFDNGAPIVQWDWHGGENQRWLLIPE